MTLPISDYMAQCVGQRLQNTRAAWAAWAFLVLAAILFIGLIIVPPLALSRGKTGLALTVYHAFRVICHQIPERSFHIEGYPLGVCARCFGVYAGFAGSGLIYPLLRSVDLKIAPPARLLVLAVVPVTLDWLAGVLNLWENTVASRTVTGALAGAAAVYFVMPGLVDLNERYCRRFLSSVTLRQSGTQMT